MEIFRRQLFLYEAPEDGAGAVDDSEPVADAAVDDAATSETAQEAAAWALSQDDWMQTVQYLQQTAPILQAVAQYLPQMQQAQGQQQQAPASPEIDPFDPESVSGYITHAINQGLEQALAEHLGPYEGMLQMNASQQGEAMARQELESIKESIGDFNQDTAFLIAAGAIDQGTDPSVALRQAAKYSHDWEASIREDERQRMKQDLQNLQGAPGETPVGSAAGSEVQPVPTGPRRYHEVVERVLARQNPTNVVG